MERNEEMIISSDSQLDGEVGYNQIIVDNVAAGGKRTCQFSLMLMIKPRLAPNL